MEVELLECGIGVLEAEPTALSYEDAASQLVVQILSQRRTTSLPLAALYLMATPEWCNPEKSISASIREQVEKSLRHAPTLFGLSVPCAYASIPRFRQTTAHSLNHGLVLVAFFSNDLYVTAEACDHPHIDPDNRLAAVNAMVLRILNRQKTHLGLGSGSRFDLFAVFPGPFMDSFGERVYLDSELHQEILEAFGDRRTLFGGSAANDLHRPTKGYQFLDNQCLESSLVVAAFEYDFQIDGRMDHGFQPIEHASVSVDSLATEGADKDYVVTHLDGKPALERLRELSKTVPFSTPRPVLGLGASSNAHIVTPISPLPTDNANPATAIRFNRQVTRGYRLSVLNSTPLELHANVSGVFKSASGSLDKNVSKVRLFLGMACIGRFQTQRFSAGARSWWGEVSDFAQQHPEIPVAFGLVAGEFGQDLRRRPRSDNLSLWVSWFKDVPHPRSANRLRMLELLRVANGLTEEGNIRSVMERAIDRPMKRLCLGGQICTVHDRFRKILGEDHGYSNARPGTDGRQIDHSLIRKFTIRDLAPDGTTYSIPPALRKWTIGTGIPTRPRTHHELDPHVENVDILPLCVANGVAIFVPDTNDPIFFCDPEIVAKSGLVSQFVMPLAGREGQLVGTLQIYFEADYSMTREEMEHWISYGQKVGVALDWAIQYTNRESANYLNKLFEKALSQSDPSSPLPIKHIEEYLEKVLETVKADHIHARIRERAGNYDRFRLVTPDSTLGEEHSRKRPEFLLRHEGSLFHLLGRPFHSTPTKAATIDEYQKQPEHYRPALTEAGTWNLLDKEINTFWMGQLISPATKEFLGALVVHSSRDYFFTQYRADLLEQAAVHLQAMLAKYESDYLTHSYKERQERYLYQGIAQDSVIHDITKEHAHSIGRKSQLARGLHSNDEKLRNYMDEISKSATTMLERLAEARKWIKQSYAQTSASRFIEDALKDMAEQAEIIRMIDASCENIDLLVHPLHVWVLKQLVDNAQEATRGKSCRIWIKSDLSSVTDDEANICVENEGPLVTYEQIDQWRMEDFTTKENAPHAGKGIPIAGMIMNQLGGKLLYRPRKDGGVTATFTLTTNRR